MGKVLWTDYSSIRKELYCKHGVGHGYHIHGCDGCCSDKSFNKAYEKASKLRRGKRCRKPR
jgi:hypothetical protein